MAVIAALELNDVFALGVGTSEPDRRHSGFCPGADEANLFYVRKCRHNDLSEIGFR